MYVLDANIFIQSNRAHYGLDFVPGFWDWLDQAFHANLICSIRKVGGEIAAGKDDLTTWAALRPKIFKPMGASCAPKLGQLSAWANSGHFTAAAVAEFLSVADYELVAYAATHGLTVVTMEKPEPQRKKKIKVPDACDALGVAWTTPFEMLRTEQARFVLNP